MSYAIYAQKSSPWNKGKLVGQKIPLKQEQVWSIRIWLEMEKKVRDLAMFNLAIDSKLRGCDLVKLKVSDVYRGSEVLTRSHIIQQKTSQPVVFEITSRTRSSLTDWISSKQLTSFDYLFPSRKKPNAHLSTRQYARLVKAWVKRLGLDCTAYGTHSMRRTKATIIYRQTKNLRAVQLLLGHTSLESTVRYLGVEVDDALELAEHIEV